MVLNAKTGCSKNRVEQIPHFCDTTRFSSNILLDIHTKGDHTEEAQTQLILVLTKPRMMPPVRTARNRKPPPDGFDDIEDTLLEFGNKMKDAENASHEGKKRHEVLWPIFQISHQSMYALVAFESVY